MRLLVVTLVLFTVVAGRAWAAFDEGKAAFERGDWPAAFAQWQPCAGAGDAACQNGLGALYRLGRGVPQDLSAAAAWFRKAADQGFAKAQANLANMYAEGAGLPQDDVAAVQWYRKAAEQGFALAQRELGRLYAAGSGVRKERSRRSAGTAKTAAQAMPDPDTSGLRLRPRPERAGGSGQAASWNRRAAERLCLAQYQLGVAYLDRSCGMRPKRPAGSSRRRRGNADAEFNLAVLYSAGSGVARDYAQAVHWFQAAADQGSVAAQYNLGVLYYHGNGVAADLAEAANRFEAAAQHAYAPAQFALGDMYRKGDGIAADPVKAYLWLSLAAGTLPAGADQDNAIKGRDATVLAMSPAQLADAQKLFGDWKPQGQGK
jgi:TPR repeat protein